VSTNGVISSGRRRGRTHSDLFKAEAVGACQQEGVSIAAVALARGVNASLLRRWLAEANASRTPIAIQRTAPAMATESQDGFVPVPIPANPTESRIRVEVRHKSRSVSIEWPASAARECALLLKELVR
jgi:transposase-like protein